MPAWKRSGSSRSCRESDDGGPTERVCALPRQTPSTAMMDVTDVLRDRMHEPAGLQRMVTLSVAVHVALVVALLLAPGAWGGRSTEPPATVMTITLGGGSGPSNGGMTAIGGRPVQI